MLLGLGYLYVYYVLFPFLQKVENDRLKRSPVGQNFVILFSCFCLK